MKATIYFAVFAVCSVFFGIFYDEKQMAMAIIAACCMVIIILLAMLSATTQRR